MRQIYLALAAVCVAALPAYAQFPTKDATVSGRTTSPITQEFVNKAIISDLYEIQSSRLALDRFLGGEFKSLAQKIIDDHTKNIEKLKSLIETLAIEAPSQLDDHHQDMIDQLQSATGEQFDAWYRNQQIAAHKEAIDLYQQYRRTGANSELRQFAENTVPMLREHLQMVRNLPPEPTALSEAPAGRNQTAQDPAEAGQRQIISSLGTDHILASDLIGTSVYGTAGEEVGEIDNVVLTRNGEAVALVVGVGGFLGLGEKNVAIPIDAVEISAREEQGALRVDRPAGASGERQTRDVPADPNRIVLRGMTRQELESAPSFERNYKPRLSTP